MSTCKAKSLHDKVYQSIGTNFPHRKESKRTVKSKNIVDVIYGEVIMNTKLSGVPDLSVFFSFWLLESCIPKDKGLNPPEKCHNGEISRIILAKWLNASWNRSIVVKFLSI